MPNAYMGSRDGTNTEEKFTWVTKEIIWLTKLQIDRDWENMWVSTFIVALFLNFSSHLLSITAGA